MMEPLSANLKLVIPGTAYSFFSQTSESKHIQNDLTRSFPLQMALFFNVTYFPVWLTTLIVMLPIKLNNLAEFNQIILGIAVIAAVTIEIIRLYMGYFGNLLDNIPGLAGFWMLSLLLQTPLQLLLLHPGLQPSLVERVSQAVMCCFLACQLFSGCIALHRLARHSAAKFHISEFLTNQETDRINVQ